VRSFLAWARRMPVGTPSTSPIATRQLRPRQSWPAVSCATPRVAAREGIRRHRDRARRRVVVVASDAIDDEPDEPRL